MRYVESPNCWSCLAASFAMILNISFKQFCRELGHDGSAIVHPGLRDPLCRRTFGIDECTLVAVRRGHSLTTLRFCPRITTDGVHMVDIPMDTEYLLRFPGVLCGMGKYNGSPCGHAVAWDGEIVLDPSIGRYPLGTNYFEPHTLYAVDIQSQKTK